MNDDIELLIAKILRIGIALAGFFLAVGWILKFHWSDNPFLALQNYRRIPLKSDLSDLCYWGLVILIVLPFTRVLLTVVLFLKNKEWLMAAFAALVSVALAFSFWLGVES
jgi:uncharacterized membrane protein